METPDADPRTFAAVLRRASDAELIFECKRRLIPYRHFSQSETPIGHDALVVERGADGAWPTWPLLTVDADQLDALYEQTIPWT